MTDERFLELHSMFMTRHYRTALYLLGNRKQAAQAAEQSWLHCCLHHACDEDRIFFQELCRELFALCRPMMETVDFQPEELLPGGQGNRTAAQAVGTLSIPQRLVLSFSSVARCELSLVAQLLELPRSETEELLAQATAHVLGRETVRVG